MTEPLKGLQSQNPTISVRRISGLKKKSFLHFRAEFWIDRGVSDDREAWEEFVLIYQPVIYQMARRQGMQDSDAQDLVQTVLMRVAGATDRWVAPTFRN